MLRRTATRFVSANDFFGVKSLNEPYLLKSYVLFGFVGSMAYLAVHGMKEVERQGPLELPDEAEAMKKKHNDPRRPPWPLLHQRVVLMREGRSNHEDLALLWEQTKHYYPADWLIPLELTQILKYTTGVYLQNYVADPDEMRKEVLLQLLNVKYGRVKDPSGVRVNRDVDEILSIAIDDLESLDLSATGNAPLVPTHT